MDTAKFHGSVCNSGSTCSFSFVWKPHYDKVRASLERGGQGDDLGRSPGKNKEQAGFPRMGDLIILIFLLGEEGNLRGISSGRGKWGSTFPHFPCLQGLV